MSEEFLHHLWLNKLFIKDLFTENNEPIKIINPGFHNLNSGPDFSNARLIIGDTVWAGNVEIHVNASDWFKHNHQNDDAYSNVVLHVVYKNDLPGEPAGIPCCVLEGKIDLNLFEAYRKFIESQLFVPCVNKISKIHEIDIMLWLERMLIERIEVKAGFIEDSLVVSENDWEEAFYQMLARSFGFNINTLPFEMLARSVKLKMISHHADSKFQVEALLFGQAGLLSHDLIDAYGQSLFSEYSFLRRKYNLVPIQPSLWKFMRLRPANFPTIRISQFAALIAKKQKLLAHVMSLEDVNEMIDFFTVHASEYWDNHYTFDKLTPGKPKNTGKQAAMLIIINAVLPFMFVYGRSTANDYLCNKALKMYEQLPGENNSIVDNWKLAGIDTSTSFRSQALIGLKNNYCDKKKCLNCRIGNLIISDPQFLTL